jgi:hypothetical protein
MLNLVKFTIQHAKNVRAGYGIPICFTTKDATDDALAFFATDNALAIPFL